MAQDDKINVIVMGANGRMGKNIIRLVLADPRFNLAGAVERSEQLPNLKDLPCPVSDSLEEILAQAPESVIIDFTAPAASIASAAIAAKHKRPMVIGTTGLTEEQKKELEEFARKTPILWSANMSVGINALLRILPLLAETLGPDYDMEIMEIHHKHKKDSPSGTALMLGDALAKSRDWQLTKTRCSSRDGIIGERPHEQIGIQALRGGDVVGIHTVYFLGPGEMIEVSHKAESRENFAQGALRAASWLAARKPGKLYNLQDALGF